MTPKPAPIDLDADKLWAALRARPDRQRRRVAIKFVWQAFRAQIRGYTGAGEARGYLAALLERLESRAVLRQPKSETAWDRSASPALPDYITLQAPATNPKSRASLASLAWPPELSFVRNTQVENFRAELLAIRSFLAQGGRQRPLVPLRERSLQLFGDEKRLDSFRRSKLFNDGQLSLELLRCYEVAPPLVYEVAEPGSEARKILVLENLHSYESFRVWNRTRGQYCAIAYGHGDEFRATYRDLMRLSRELGVSDIAYFGDIDVKGLAILAYAREGLRASGSRLRLQADERWYAALLEFEAQPLNKPNASRASQPHAELVAQTLAPRLATRILKILNAGLRLPQEWIGSEYLADCDGDGDGDGEN